MSYDNLMEELNILLRKIDLLLDIQKLTGHINVKELNKLQERCNILKELIKQLEERNVEK